MTQQFWNPNQPPNQTIYPGQVQYAQPQYPQQPPNPYGPPPQAAQGGQQFQQAFQPLPPVDPMQVLQGLSEQAIDTRFPFFPPNGQFDVEILSTPLKPGASVGPAFYIECRVHQSSLPNVPAGSNFAHRIAGFTSFKARGFAMSELKQFMAVALRHTGLQETWIPDASKQESWERLAAQMAQQNLAKGARCYLMTSQVGKGQYVKTKSYWIAPAA